MRRCLCSRLFLLAVTSWCLATTAMAATSTQQIQFGPGSADFANATGAVQQGGDGATRFNLFNSNTGVLNSITFSNTFALSSTITVTNTSAGGATGSVRTESGARFSSSITAITAAFNRAVNTNAGGVSFGASSLAPVAYDLLGNNNIYNLAAGTSQQYTSQGNGTTGPFVDTNASDLTAFSSATGGTYQVLFSTLTGVLLNSTGGNAQASQQTVLQGTFTLTYNYTPATVPEPSTWAVLAAGAGLVSVLALRRRQRAQ